MKLNFRVLVLGMLCVLISAYLAPPASAASQSASATWGDSVTITNATAAYNNALTGYVMRHRIGPYSSAMITYTDRSTNYTTTNCTVAGGCQTGGSTISVNGYTATTVTGNGNVTTTGVTTTGTNQTSTASSVVTPGGSINTITIGGGH